MRTVPRRERSLVRSRRSGRFGRLHPRISLFIGWLGLGGEDFGGENAGLSVSGGGVGGKMLRWTGGSDCCRLLLWRCGWTRFEAAKEIDSGGRSSRSILSLAMFIRFVSDLVEPTLGRGCSEDAISLALPK